MNEYYKELYELLKAEVDAKEALEKYYDSLN